MGETPAPRSLPCLCSLASAHGSSVALWAEIGMRKVFSKRAREVRGQDFSSQHSTVSRTSVYFRSMSSTIKRLTCHDDGVSLTV